MNRIFSGVQPSGNLHIGNYLGAIKNWVSLQKDFECIFCIVDLHALTVKQDPKELENNTLEVTAAYIASGINPEKTLIWETGIWGFNLILVVLLLPVAAKWANWPELRQYRRAIGLWAFFYATAHFRNHR